MKNPSPGVKNIITPTEAIDYFVLSRRKFYDLLIGCIFRKNRALAPHERSAVPLGTDHCPVC